MFQGRLQQHTNARTSSQLGLSVNSQRLLAGLAGAEPLHLAPAVVEVPDEVLDCSGPTIYHIQLIPLNYLSFTLSCALNHRPKMTAMSLTYKSDQIPNSIAEMPEHALALEHAHGVL